jgi:hypothetical protein
MGNRKTRKLGKGLYKRMKRLAAARKNKMEKMKRMREDELLFGQEGIPVEEKYFKVNETYDANLTIAGTSNGENGEFLMSSKSPNFSENAFSSSTSQQSVFDPATCFNTE